MKRYIKQMTALIIVASMILVVPFSVCGVEQDGYVLGVEQGKIDAQTNYSWPAWAWGVAGAAGGYLHGIIGGGVFTYASTLFEPWVNKESKESIKEEAPEFQAGYIAGYKEFAQKKNTKFSAVGAGIGIIVLLLTND